MLRLCIRSRLLLLAAVVIGLIGCEEKRDFGPRVKTYSVIGAVTVDGQPIKTLLVVANPVEKPAVPTKISAFTVEDGRFELSTYEQGDGIPAGEYTLTFLWGQYNLMSGQYGGPDRLKGMYKDPKKSEVKFTVDPTKPTDLGTIALTTGGGDGKKK